MTSIPKWVIEVQSKGYPLEVINSLLIDAMDMTSGEINEYLVNQPLSELQKAVFTSVSQILNHSEYTDDQHETLLYSLDIIRKHRAKDIETSKN